MNIARQQSVGFTLWKLLCLAGFLFLVVIEAEANRDTTPYNKCIANLKIIDGAVQQWALDTQQGETNTYSLADPKVQAYFPSHQLPVCPRAGTYLSGADVRGHPSCSFHGSLETAEEKDIELAMTEAKRRLVLPVVSTLVGLLLISPWSRIPLRIRNWLPVPVTLAYLVAFAPYYFAMMEVGRAYAAANAILIFGTLTGGLVLSVSGLRGKERAVRLFAIVTSAYCAVFFVSAFMHFRL
jgi:hypothetical protein